VKRTTAGKKSIAGKRSAGQARIGEATTAQATVEPRSAAAVTGATS
jgi:hypothetical protein